MPSPIVLALLLLAFVFVVVYAAIVHAVCHPTTTTHASVGDDKDGYIRQQAAIIRDREMRLDMQGQRLAEQAEEIRRLRIQLQRYEQMQMVRWN